MRFGDHCDERQGDMRFGDHSDESHA
jgi:hypothetical protein